MTKELVELHGGSISVESHVGKGSIFRFSLPLAASIYRDAVRLESYPVAMQKVSSPKVLDTVPVSNILDQPLVLLIDDNADIRQFIKKQLQAQFQIIDAADGQEGLQKAIDTVPDLIISDLMMPKMDGMEFCQKVRDDQRTAHIPVIMLTARADMGSKLEGLEKGADAYLTKPFNAEELRIRVRKMIEQRQKLRDQFAAILKLETTNIQLDSLDEQFIKNAIEIVEAQIDNPDFTVEAFQKVLGMSKTQLHRKLKALTDQSASEFIRTLRIKRAAQYLKKNSQTVSEAAYSVGFNNLSYFAKCFREQFGKTPSQYP